MSGLIPILFQDVALLVCVKPVGLESERALPERLRSEQKAEVFPVHRLDTAVGGVMVYAKTPKAAAKLSRAIAEGRLEKDYLAVCAGRPEPEAGELRDLLFKDAAKNKSYVVKRMRKGVREAVLRYSVLESAGNASLLSIHLETGRSHQIRVQFASRAHPLLGDVKYGSAVRDCPIALWSHRLRFPHPVSGQPMVFSALPPEAFPWSSFAMPEAE